MFKRAENENPNAKVHFCYGALCENQISTTTYLHLLQIFAFSIIFIISRFHIINISKYNCFYIGKIKFMFHAGLLRFHEIVKLHFGVGRNNLILIKKEITK